MKFADKLKWLMNSLDISGRELSQQLGVDYSIVSKWRTGQRRMTMRSKHIKNLAEILLDSQGEKSRGIIAEILHGQYPDIDLSDPCQAINALCLWLTMPEIPQADVHSAFGSAFEPLSDISTGTKNMFSMQKQFFKMLGDLPSSQLVTVTNFGAVDWSVPNAQLQESIINITMDALNRGHKMHIIDMITETYRPWESMFRWLPLYLHENSTVYYIHNTQPYPLRENLYDTDGCFMLSAVSTTADPEAVITSFYDDEPHMALYGNVLNELRRHCHLLIHKLPVDHIYEILDLIDSHMKSARLLYMVNRLPTFRNMPQALLKEILIDNNVPENLMENILRANKKSTSTRTRCLSRQIYDLDAVEAAAEQDSTVEQELSLVVGRPIYVRRNQFLRQLDNIRSRLNEDLYQMVLYPFSKLPMSYVPPFNVIVQDDSLCVAWDAPKYQYRMYSEELSVVNGFFQLTGTIWNHIPPMCKSVSWCGKQIDRLLTEYSRDI